MKKAFADESLELKKEDFEKPEGLRIDDILDCDTHRNTDPFSIDDEGESIFD